MKLSYDPIKSVLNQAKHGFSLAMAADFNWETALVWTDSRKDYGELRQSALVMWEGRLYFVAFVYRADERRIISLRKANVREVKYYVSEN
ncbi:MAG: BrnT family toxin [Gallionella sp.]